MSDKPSEQEPAKPSKFAFLSRLLGRLRRSKDAEQPATEDHAASSSGNETEGDGTDEVPKGFVHGLVSSPVKLVLLIGAALVVTLVIVLIVVLFNRKHKAKPINQSSTVAAASKHDVLSSEARLAVENKKLKQERDALLAEKTRLEADKRELEEKLTGASTGHVLSAGGRVVVGPPSSGECNLSGEKDVLRENLRKCLGMPPKQNPDPLPKWKEALQKDKAGKAVTHPDEAHVGNKEPLQTGNSHH